MMAIKTSALFGVDGHARAEGLAWATWAKIVAVEPNAFLRVDLAILVGALLAKEAAMGHGDCAAGAVAESSCER